MITSTIGKMFLEAYNKKYGTNYDAKTFFIEVYYSLFFDSNKYLQWVQNSSFVQMKKGQKVDNLTSEERKKKLQNFINKVEKCIFPDASIAPGFPASEEEKYAATSGQSSNIIYPFTKEDIYLSWIGSSLGIGVQGGLCILLFNSEILLDVFEGWCLYRKVLNETPQLKGDQINTWNGQWISHYYSRNYSQEQPMADFAPFEFKKEEGMLVATQSWIKVLIGIAQRYDIPKMMGYVYGFGKVNITIGFIPFCLDHIRRPIQLYKKLFGIDEGKKAEDLWGTENGLKVCCQRGLIGLESMKPKGLQKYIMDNKGEKEKLPRYKDNQLINYHIYQIWLLAMLEKLDKDELWTRSIEFAQTLQSYTKKAKSGKTINSRRVENVLNAGNKNKFINGLTEIMSDSDEVDCFAEIARIINPMQKDEFSYFLTLIGFQYTMLNKKQ